MKRKSLAELQDCLDLLRSQLNELVSNENYNPKHIAKVSGWYDKVALEIEYRNVLATKSPIQDDDHKSYTYP